MSLASIPATSGARRVYSATPTHEVFAPLQNLEEDFYARVAAAQNESRAASQSPASSSGQQFQTDSAASGESETEATKAIRELQTSLFRRIEASRHHMVNAASLIQGVLESSNAAARKGDAVLGVTERVQIRQTNNSRKEQGLDSLLKLLTLKRSQRHDTIYSVLKQQRTVLYESLQHSRAFCSDLSALSRLWSMRVQGAQREVSVSFANPRAKAARLASSRESGVVCLTGSTHRIEGALDVSQELHNRHPLQEDAVVDTPSKSCRVAGVRRRLRQAIRQICREYPLARAHTSILPHESEASICLTLEMTKYTSGTWRVLVWKNGHCRVKVFDLGRVQGGSQVCTIDELHERIRVRK
jgi:hypothetical protein